MLYFCKSFFYLVQKINIFQHFSLHFSSGVCIPQEQLTSVALLTKFLCKVGVPSAAFMCDVAILKFFWRMKFRQLYFQERDGDDEYVKN